MSTLRSLRRAGFASFVSALLLLGQSAKASYPSAMPNHDLREELEAQTDRMIPKVDWFSAAVDGQSYLRNLGTNDFYHGVGYWIQGRTEFRPQKFFKLNVRTILYSGSFSGGYAEPTGFYNIVGLSGLWPDAILGGTIDSRAMDIERQTIGQGLLIENREMAGVWLRWKSGPTAIKFLMEGTGGLVLGDDLINYDMSFFDGLVDLGAIVWTAGDQSSLPSNRAHALYLSSTHPIADGIRYFAEAGARNSVYAGLLGLEGKGQLGQLSVSSTLQGRYYDNRFGSQFVRNIQHMYISYDQYDKPYTNTANVFAVDDNAYVYSVRLDLDYALSDQWTVFAYNEVGSFDYRDANDDTFHFYRAGVTYRPLVDRQESITIFASNKVLNDSYTRPPSMYSVTNQALFKSHPFLGAEAVFRF